MIALLAPTVIKPRIPTFSPTPIGVSADTLTVDAGDEHRWAFVDLDRRSIVAPPDTAGWDVMLRRFHFVPAFEIRNAGRVAFDSVESHADSGFVRSVFARDSSNPVTTRWYSYSYFSHLLEPKPDVYVLKTREGRQLKVQFLSYYCPGNAGPTPGCTTFRFGPLTN